MERGDIIQNKTDGLGGVQPGRHRHQFALRHANELGVRAVDRHRGNNLARLDSRDALAEPINHPNQIPPRCVGDRGVSG